MSDDEKKSENQIATVPPPAPTGDGDAFDAATRIGPVPEEIRLLIEEKLAAKGAGAPAPRLTPPSGVPRPAAIPRTSLRPSMKPLTDHKREARVDDESTMMVGNVADLMDSNLARPTPPPRAQDDDEEEEDSTRMLEPDWQASSPILNAEKDAAKGAPASTSMKQTAPGPASVKKPVTAPTPPVAMQPGMTPEAALAEANKGMSGVMLFCLIIAFFLALAAALVFVVKYVVR